MNDRQGRVGAIAVAIAVLAGARGAHAQDMQLEGDVSGEATTGGDAEAQVGGEARGPAAEGDAATTDGAAVATGVYPTMWAPRPMTLPQSTLSIRGDFRVVHFPPIPLPVIDNPDTGIAILAGVKFGILDDLEIGVAPFALTIVDGDADYGDIQAYVMYRFLRLAEDIVELGALAGVIFPIQSEAVQLEVGVPAVIHPIEPLRIETGVLFSFDFLDPLFAAVRIPLLVGYSILEPLFAGVRTGISKSLTSEGGSIPVGLFAGWTFGAAGGPPVVDLTGYFEFPDVDETSDWWILGLTADVYLYL